LQHFGKSVFTPGVHKLFSLYDFSIQYRLVEVKNIIFSRTWYSTFLGDSSSYVAGHSLLLNICQVYGIFGLALMSLPLAYLVKLGLRNFDKGIVMVGISIAGINFLFYDYLLEWVLLFIFVPWLYNHSVLSKKMID